MTTLLQITRYLNKELDIKNIPDESKNGIQFRSKKKEVKKIGFAIDACIEVFEKAKKQKCDLVLVHHGIIWKDQKPHKRIHFEKRVNFLKKNKISLFGCHLPLDLHLKLGNAAVIAKLLNMKKVEGFGEYKEVNVGVKGEIKSSSLKNIEKIINKKLKTKCTSFEFKKGKIKKIGIVTGGGASVFPDASKEKLDLFITGEQHHSTYHSAKESKINLIFAGHYATETLGVKALMPVLKDKFGVETVFIDVPTGL